jgi:c(7)-type cytochrome triheme protein
MRRIFGVALLVLLVPTLAAAQTGVKKRRPLPPEYGLVVMGTTYAEQKLPDARFDHWLHRAKYTCRVCHVDIGFAMKTNGTGIRAEDNARGFYCGACHNGKMKHEDRAIFESCSPSWTAEDREGRCLRCHYTAAKSLKPRHDFFTFIADLPKERFGNGVNWEEAEVTGRIKPVDFVEGSSFKRKGLDVPKDIDISAKVSGMNEILFSHRKHTVWSGCEGCHPEIFMGIKKGTTKYSMIEIFEGKYCGQCHLTVAFPMTDCQRCHTKPVK